MQEKNALNEDFSKIMVKACRDPEFKQQLLSNPIKVLRSEGIDFKEGVNIHIVENTDTDFYLVLPQISDRLSEEELEALTGGCDKGCISYTYGEYLNRNYPGKASLTRLGPESR